MWRQINYPPIPQAEQSQWQKRAYSYLQIVKRRFRRRLITVKKTFVKGTEKDFPGKTQNTSFIERFNLTLRQRVSYLARKTLGYCKDKRHFQWVLWINLFDYNYRAYHKSLRISINVQAKRFEQRYEHRTPSMAIGLTTAQLSWRYLITVPIRR